MPAWQTSDKDRHIVIDKMLVVMFLLLINTSDRGLQGTCFSGFAYIQSAQQ